MAERLDLWAEVLSDPKHLFSRQKKHATYEEGHKHLMMGALIFSALFAFTFKILPGVSPKVKPMDLSTIFLFIVINAASAFLAVVLLVSLNYLFAKAFGGKGKFAEQYYLNAIILAPVLILYYLVKLFPGIGWLIGIGILLYYAYVNIRMLEEVHRLSTPKAFASLFIPSAVILFVLILLGIMQKVPLF